MEPASCSIGPGIRSDDEVLESDNCHMQMLDHGLSSIDLFAKGKPCYEKYQKLLPREKLMFQALIRRALRNSFKTEFLGVIHQLKVLNDKYSTEIPLLLVSNFYNDYFVQMVAKDYGDKKLNIHIIKQVAFSVYFAWYNPSEVFTLFEQVKRHYSVNEKEYILLLNSGMENVVDLKIFNYLCESRDGPKIDICFEVIKPRVSDLSNGSEFLVKSGERLRVLSENSLHEACYNIDADGLLLTKNLWISIPFLRNEESGTTLLEIAFANELAVGDGERSEIRLEMTLENLIEYLKNDEAEEDVDRLSRQKREERELNIFWIENAVWLLLVTLYFLVLTSRRLKNANKSRSPHQRQSRAWADFAQALLLGTTRFLYAGLNKTAEVKEWFGGNAWLYLLPLHFLSSILEVAGSLLIMYFIKAPEVMEPLETS
ncbi:hypothetical protein ACQ4PT_070440 [Festuca glaucescens]